MLHFVQNLNLFFHFNISKIFISMWFFVCLKNLCTVYFNGSFLREWNEERFRVFSNILKETVYCILLKFRLENFFLTGFGMFVLLINIQTIIQLHIHVCPLINIIISIKLINKLIFGPVINIFCRNYLRGLSFIILHIFFNIYYKQNTCRPREDSVRIILFIHVEIWGLISTSFN